MKIFAIRPLRYLIVTLFWLGVWFLAAHLVNLPLLLPGPVHSVVTPPSAASFRE